MRSENPSIPFAATSGEKILQARKPETSRFYILSEKTWRTSAVTIWLHPRTTISAINDVVSYKVAPRGVNNRRGAIVWRVCPQPLVFAAVHESAFGTKRTAVATLALGAWWLS